MSGRRRMGWVAALLALCAAGVIVLIVVNSSTPDSDVHDARVEVRRPTQDLLTAASQELSLTVGGVENCAGEETKPAELDRLDVEQTQTEIIIGASLRIYESEAPCENSFANVPVAVQLDQPLGGRLVVDDSRGEHLVISSPASRGELLRSSHRSATEATEFVRVRFPAGTEAHCARGGDRGFRCTYHRGTRVISFDVFVLPGGRFGAASSNPNFNSAQ